MDRPTILFWINSSRGRGGMGVVTCRITYKGERTNLSISAIELDRWDGESKRVKGQKPDAWLLNKEIVEMEYRILDLFDKRNPNSIDEFKAYWFNKNVAVRTDTLMLKNVFKEFVSVSKLSDSTIRGYSAAITCWKNFLLHSRGIEDIFINVVTRTMWAEFEVWMNTSVDGLEPQSKILYMSKLGGIISFAAKIGTIDKNPIEEYGYEITKKLLDTTVVLNRKISHEDEHTWKTSVIDHQQQENARRLFVFQMLTGMAWADVSNVSDFSSITSTDIGGRKIIQYFRQKTQVTAIVPVLPELSSFLKKYGSDLEARSYSSYTDNLFAAAAALGVPYEGSHAGRHTFGADMLEMGFSMESVSRMLGHSSIKETEKVYSKVNSEKIHSDLDRINKAV